MKHAAFHLSALVLLLISQANAQSTVSFGVLGLFHPHVLLLSPAGSQPLLITGTGMPLVLNSEPGKRQLLLRASGDHVLLADGSATRLEISARDGLPVRLRIEVPGKLQRTYEGTLAITAAHGELLAVVAMGRETAVATIVASEMPVDAPAEALKAQAVVTRSFLMAGARHAAFDFCDTTHCQYLRSPDEATARVRTAVADTRGLVLTWHGKAIAARYSSRCGGSTRSLSDAGSNPADGYPYYAVVCTWCQRHPLRITTADTTIPGLYKNSGASMRRRVGLCQFGAMGMAADGADFRSILEHYYPNTELKRWPLHLE